MGIFKTPSEVLFGQITKPQANSINFVKQKISQHESTFDVPYPHRANFQMLKKLLEDSKWELIENMGETSYTWTLKPML
jgi:hypothetical protein